MVTCKYCGKEVPLEELLPHINREHQEESRKKNKEKTEAKAAQKKAAKAKIEDDKLKAVGATTEPASDGTSPEPETEVAPVEENKQKTVEVTKEPPFDEVPENLSETGERGKVETTTVKTAGIFTYEMTLPADAFTLFNLAKACELETNKEKTFDEWVWDCITARFSKDYKKQLVLAPVEE